MIKVQMKDRFWNKYMEVVRKEVIPYQWNALNDRLPDTEPSHAIENLKIAAGEARGEFYGMVFQDSDVAKWLEAVAFSLENHPDQALEETADELIDLLGRAQQEDGYLNTYYTIKAPEQRWTNVRDNHELYCAGHLIEAAVAYYQVTGKRKFLDIMCNYTDYIDTVFGNEEGKIRGYPGHQEIELALVKLFDVTGNERYLELSKYFIDQRGQNPHYFDMEREKRGDTNPFFYHHGYEYHQAHEPVRDQEKAVGHSVRAIYMYAAMADLALKTNDDSLRKACERLWDNLTKKQMYITAGVGSSEFGEAFSFDYDLPNDTAYTETCASIALVFWAKRMLDLETNSKYADVMERALYNGTISGMDLDGKKFFYVNPLEVWPKACTRHDKRHVKPVRQPWFTCACCPPNLARLISSIGHYMYSKDDNQLFVHLYAGNQTDVELNGQMVNIIQTTEYPWDEKVTLSINPETADSFTIALRIPGWCKQPELWVNGERIHVGIVSKDGYAYIQRTWEKGDHIELLFPMPVRRMKSHPSVRVNAGKVALQRGPVVYCLEEVDNGKNLSNIYLPKASRFDVTFDKDLLEGVVTIKGDAVRIDPNAWEDNLYASNDDEQILVEIKAIPYYAWCNRSPGEMLVWINEV
ncbi:glycoside hydrolase family 127 protein [Oceanobacillus bengalensis]|uniref:Glycoside hydrolase family 127 protein n=1 Tax=Oceanobacillus bengalensis TaxID=1435466 RepID=A0A494YZN8_9BACI|nr:beta-L-arabinofuranosidase domain-containing protein [Oceanobacillus bengalensis]RKQ15679.1 glycoside hydrolase family 127 protein [Oceanobacillus bengalensis]